MRYAFVALVCQMGVSACIGDDRGTESKSRDATSNRINADLILRAIDIDTGAPVPGGKFWTGTLFEYEWATELGRSKRSGELHVPSFPKPNPTRYYWVTATDGYRVAGLDEVIIDPVPGETVVHDFKLRARPPTTTFPPVRDLPNGYRNKVSTPKRQPGKSEMTSKVANMPGFAGRPVTFSFVSPDGQVSTEQSQLALRIFLNGRRVAAAVRDELVYFQKAVPEGSGEIDEMQEVQIRIGTKLQKNLTGGKWTFSCRLSESAPLHEGGYKIEFDDLKEWRLSPPGVIPQLRQLQR